MKLTAKQPGNLFFVLLTVMFWVFVTPLSAAENHLSRISLKEQGGATYVILDLKKQPDFEIVENLSRNVLTLKIRNSTFNPQYALKRYKNDLISMVRITPVTADEYWVQLRLLKPDLKFAIVPRLLKKGMLVVRLNERAKQKKDESARIITSVRRGRHPDYDRVVLSLNRKAQYSIVEKLDPDYHVEVKLLFTGLTDGLKVPELASLNLKEVSLRKDGKHTYLTLVPKKGGLGVKHYFKSSPTQLVLDVSKAPLPAEMQKEEKKESPEDLQQKLAMQERFVLAERHYMNGKMTSAAKAFKQIFNMAPNTELGVRSYFRAADAFYYRQKHKDEQSGYQFVIQEYIQALNAAENMGLELDDVPKAIFHIAQSYQEDDFFDEAFSYYRELLSDYPESIFAKEALFNTGKLEFNRGHYEKAIQILNRFMKENPDNRLESEAIYKIAESYFQLKDFKQSKLFFDRARSINPSYPQEDPELMYHMGEAYFENQLFQTARSIFEDLLEKFPEESFSQLVALRIGDFLRAENKEESAVRAYQKAIRSYPNGAGLEGRLRIANIYANRPKDDEHNKALKLYDEIIEKYPLSEQYEEALLRKGLTLSLFGHHDKAIAVLEKFEQEFPKNLYVVNRVIYDRIMENIFSQMAKHYWNKEYFELLSVMEKHREKYFQPIPANSPLLMMADSSSKLGLIKETQELYDMILQKQNTPHHPLALMEQGKALMRTFQYPEAQKKYENFLMTYPSDQYAPQVWKLLGDTYVKSKQVDKGILAYRKIIQMYKNSIDPYESELVPLTYHSLGVLYQELGRYEDALLALKQVIRTFNHPIEDKNVLPYVKETFYLIGDLLYEMNQSPEALKAYKTALQLYPESEKAPWARYQTGQIYWKDGDKDKAIQVFDQLVKESENQPDALWGQLAKESQKDLLNELRYDKYLNQIPSAANPPE